MKTLVYIVTCVVMLSVISCTSRNKGGDDVQVLMKDSTVISASKTCTTSPPLFRDVQEKTHNITTQGPI